MIPTMDLSAPLLQWTRIPDVLYARVERDGRLTPRYPNGVVPDFTNEPRDGTEHRFVVHWAWVPDGCLVPRQPNSCVGWSAHSIVDKWHPVLYWTRWGNRGSPSLHDTKEQMYEFTGRGDPRVARMALTWAPATP